MEKNKLKTITIAIMGACSVSIEIFLPIILISLLIIPLLELNSIEQISLLIISGIASLFRALKYGGWLRKYE